MADNDTGARATLSASSDPIQVGDLVAGKYRVDRVLGEGGMGVVVAATHEQLDERVALKFLRPVVATNPEIVQRFVREARAAVKVRSEHVARVLDVGTIESGTPYMVMEYLDGQDLAQTLAARGPLPVSETITYVLQTCEAVAEAHSLGIVHRDLKPANLFLARRPSGLRTCQAVYQQSCLGIMNAPSSGQSIAGIEACVQELSPPASKWSCGDYLFNQNPPPDCQVPAGALANGAPCALSQQCQSAFCSVATGKMCGTCAPALQAGGSCAGLAGCPRTYSCVTASQKCEGFVNTGGSCTPALPCRCRTRPAAADPGCRPLEASMNRPQIEELVTRWATQAVAAGRDEVWDDLLSDDVIDRSGGGEARGRESFKARARAVQAAFGDRVVAVDDLVVDGDRIAWRWTLTGTHVGPFLDIQPTGGRVTLRGVNFQRLRDGAVVEHWTLADLAGLARQLRAHFATQL